MLGWYHSRRSSDPAPTVPGVGANPVSGISTIPSDVTSQSGSSDCISPSGTDGASDAGDGPGSTCFAFAFALNEYRGVRCSFSRACSARASSSAFKNCCITDDTSPSGTYANVSSSTSIVYAVRNTNPVFSPSRFLFASRQKLCNHRPSSDAKGGGGLSSMHALG